MLFCKTVTYTLLLYRSTASLIVGTQYFCKFNTDEEASVACGVEACHLLTSLSPQ